MLSPHCQDDSYKLQLPSLRIHTTAPDLSALPSTHPLSERRLTAASHLGSGAVVNRLLVYVGEKEETNDYPWPNKRFKVRQDLKTEHAKEVL